MQQATTESQTLAEHYVNLVEPISLLGCFLAHPPEGFSAQLSDQGMPYFSTRFDLLTTMDAQDRHKVMALPGYRWWQGLLHKESYFIGSTVTEYTPFPRNVIPSLLVTWIRTHCGAQKSLTIIKDIPQQSPFISAEEACFNTELEHQCAEAGFIAVEGQALAFVPLDTATEEEYLKRLSRSRRRDIRRKLKKRAELRIEVWECGETRWQDPYWLDLFYDYYLAVYAQSEIHFDRLDRSFFAQLLQDPSGEGKVFCYWLGEVLVGFNLCYVHQGCLIDKYIGLNYPLAREYNLYFISWFVNLEYARTHGLHYYIAGWTDPEVKAALGAQFTFTRHWVWVKNPVLRFILRRLSHLFESDHQWHQTSQPQRSQNLR